MSRAALAFAFCGLALLAGCGGARPSADGRANGYTPGVPDFDLDASVISAVDPVEIEALVSIPRSSLVFTRDDEGFRTIVRTAFRLSDLENTPLASPARADTLRVATYAETASFVPLVVRQRLPAVAGALVVQAEVEDVRTGRTALRRLSIRVPEPSEGLALGLPRLRGILATTQAYQPLLALGVPSDLDSLQVRLDVFGAAGAVSVRADLLRLRADTTVAEPPSAFAPSRVSLRARGVLASDPDTVLVSRQRIPSPDARLTIETALPPLAPGVYRIVMTAEGDAREEATTERTFVVRPEDFPLLVGVEDLVQPLAYLATPREKNLLRDAGPDSLRFAFDAFWGGLFRDRRQAAATFRAYYERVEEANRRFSTYTEGWKTDRGMIYVIFGPPERVENRFDREVWSYASGVFAFERTARRESGDAPFDVWTLVRDRAYDAQWRRAIRLWRNGQPP
ncbi:GWxTD domain-containing protein [Rubricoccus marinus]|uniref:GWxTD domain-containing protein n=1 Tax=Rubricoccus marinus TaxID=716817 RepID=A0A259TYI2_9BACT|nr:GWxTD domain-containing protein [Rubricoccus marinus]OZC02835.1 hypothetical protein BSZ36_07520 [Rubricoccus marinus]